MTNTTTLPEHRPGRCDYNHCQRNHAIELNFTDANGNVVRTVYACRQNHADKLIALRPFGTAVRA